MQPGRECIYGIKLRREIRLIRGTTADVQRLLASCPNAIIVKLKDEQAASKWLSLAALVVLGLIWRKNKE